MTRDMLRHLLSQILGDGSFEWPELDPGSSSRLFDIAKEHGVHRIAGHRLWQRGVLDSSPARFRELVTASLRNQVLVEEGSAVELRRVLDALAAADVRPLLFKGAALAYTHYPDPVLRPRVDTDILVEECEIARAGAALERLGYQREPFTSGELVMHQAPYRRTDTHGVPHAIDLHWKISNPQVFARALQGGELVRRAVPVPALGEHACAIGSVHALALSCIHQAAHHGHEDRLIWVYDVHLLTERLRAAERQEFVSLAADRELTGVCRHQILRAWREFRGRGADDLLARLATTSAHDGPADVYVTRRMKKVDVLRSDLAALSGWRLKLRLLREHVFPPRSYMQQVYGVASPAVLPLLYAWRVARGARGWWR
jgi:hypothetical protein